MQYVSVSNKCPLACNWKFFISAQIPLSESFSPQLCLLVQESRPETKPCQMPAMLRFWLDVPPQDTHPEMLCILDVNL